MKRVFVYALLFISFALQAQQFKSEWLPLDKDLAEYDLDNAVMGYADAQGEYYVGVTGMSKINILLFDKEGQFQAKSIFEYKYKVNKKFDERRLLTIGDNVYLVYSNRDKKTNTWTISAALIKSGQIGEMKEIFPSLKLFYRG